MTRRENGRTVAITFVLLACLSCCPHASSAVPSETAVPQAAAPPTQKVVFQFDGWKSHLATKANPDGTTSFISIDPGVRGFEFNAPAAKGTYTRLTLRDAQHKYDYEAVPAQVSLATKGRR
jgi:hypothetical protein